MLSLGHGAPQVGSRIGMNYNQERRSIMQVKIEGTARELKPLKGAGPNAPLYTGLKIDGKWYNIHGDRRNLYKKVVDLELNGNIARFAAPQKPPAPTQQPPAPRPP